MMQWRQSGHDLPWGWWLRAHGGVLEDEEGRSWRSVREAFWRGRLDFPDIHVAAEQHELLLRVLTAIDGRWVGGTERKDDLFEGSMIAWRFYQCWLASIGLLEMSGDSPWSPNPLEAPLSADGRSVMLMLQATRDPEWEQLPMSDIIAAVAASARGPVDDTRELALKAFERGIGLRRYVFARERIARSYMVTLTGIDAGIGVRMPVRRVTWSQAFADARPRDDLFVWLAQRVDRWDDWGTIAYRRSADALTEHLFALFVGGTEQRS